MHIRKRIHTHIYIYIYVFMLFHVYTCVYIYVYIDIYICIYIYIHVCISATVPSGRWACNNLASGLLYFWIGIPEGALAPPSRIDRIPSNSHFRLLAILPLMLAILPVLLATLAPTCPTSALKMPEKCHLGANIAKSVLQPPFQAPPKY